VSDSRLRPFSNESLQRVLASCTDLRQDMEDPAAVIQHLLYPDAYAEYFVLYANILIKIGVMKCFLWYA
jgi:hypothetical protein